MRRRALSLCVAWYACAAWCAYAVFAATAGGRELRVLQADARATFFVGIAAPPSAAAVVRAFNHSLAEISHTYLAGDNPLHLRNITLQPLYIELPEDERFSARLLEQTCSAVGGRRVAVLLVCGGGDAASAVVSAAVRAGVPVIRASPSHLHLSYTIANEMLPLEIRLEITARETLHALRATLLHTHWHSFTLLAVEDIYSTFSLRKDLSSILTTQPLNPKWLSLPTKYSRHALFRRLAEVSRLTRGVVVLICDIHYAKLVMDEAKRLNMLDGHFFWLWIDASTEFDVFHNIGDRKQYTDINDQDNESFGAKSTALKQEDTLDRYRRDDPDNNFIKDAKAGNISSKSINLSEKILNNDDGINVKNSSINSIFRRTSRNINKSEAHSVNNKLLNINISQSFDSSRNISSEGVRNYYVNNKGVETSKIEKNSIEKGKMSFLNRDNSRRISFSKMKNESFNKYVNSINVGSVNDDENSSVGKLIHNNNENSPLKDNILLASDISDFLMNPTVQTSIMHNVRDKMEKRKDHNFKEEDVKDSERNQSQNNISEIFNSLPVGLLALHPQPMKIDPTFIRAAVRMAVGALRRVLQACDAWSAQAQFFSDAVASCWDEPSDAAADFSTEFVRETRIASAAVLSGGTGRSERTLTAFFALLNLVPGLDGENTWRQVGRVEGRKVSLHTIVWPGGRLVAHGQSDGARTIFRIVTALAPPFVMEGELDEDGQCLRGLPCHRPQTSDRDNLTLAFNDLDRDTDQETSDFFFPTPKPMYSKMATHCCYGLAMDLLENIAQELEFDFHLYIVEDGLYGSRKLVKPFHKFNEYRSTTNEFLLNQQSYRSQYRNGYKLYSEDYMFGDDPEEDPEKWTGIVGDLVSGAAHMSFAALSVSSARAEVIDFSQPYFFSGVSILAAPNQRPDIPLLAFLLPFSPELWIAIFTSLNVTAIAVAIYEWLSPFGLNPWGRQRSKNFSISSALWVMWGLLCGHLVAFKAPKSWPNKFLINVWGGFSVIFVASYTANIAALIAGLFFHNAVDDYQGRSNWLSLRVGTAKSSVSEYYVQRNNPQLAQQMRRYALQDIEDGIQRLRNGTLDLLIADTPVLDYYRATDHGCKLQRVGDHTLAEDTYAIGMAKGFPLKDSISAVIAKYSSNGYMDILTEKWYGGLPCFKLSPDYGIQPKPLGVAAVAGVFILLGVGMIVGCLILILEHLFYKYTLPVLRHQPKGTIWRSRNIMFFSQKLYRFINCVELVSPHHAARELVNTIRQGHFTSLFQKSVKRKEHEQRRRRKSKAQLYEMIQAIRRVQQRDHSLGSIKEQEPAETTEVSEELTESKFLSPSPEVPARSPRQGRSPRQLRSPRGRRKRCSLAGLNVRRFSTDSVLDSESVSVSNIYERTSLNIGRRLSRDISCLTNSPPDINSRLRTPSPMVRRAEGSSTRSYQDVSERSDNYISIDGPTSRASVEILVSEESDLPPVPPYPRVPPMGARSELSQLSEEELIRLWRSSEREVREALLAALQERRANLDPKQDPG
ncbi:uncharacterized protein LOC113511860 isoform X1 [Galleria mellonella]|uniref:Uncharacterized protein LOC113511860 isoform X1 n=1 Tax=Galleria mellonella TaxID=7137 RepID=A0A6J1WCR8_GALME|nr:uncharacterized protein LOC113511860 isoform X1 [Galleria mellonella]